MDNGVESQPVLPGSGEVPHVNVGVAGSLHLTPEKERVLGRPRLGRLGLLLYVNVLYLQTSM